MGNPDKGLQEFKDVIAGLDPWGVVLVQVAFDPDLEGERLGFEHVGIGRGRGSQVHGQFEVGKVPKS